MLGYAKFGKISEGEAAAGEEFVGRREEATHHAADATAATDASKSAKRVSAETHDLFGHYETDDALASAPTTSGAGVSEVKTPERYVCTGEMLDSSDMTFVQRGCSEPYDSFGGCACQYGIQAHTAVSAKVWFEY